MVRRRPVAHRQPSFAVGLPAGCGPGREETRGGTRCSAGTDIHECKGVRTGDQSPEEDLAMAANIPAPAGVFTRASSGLVRHIATRDVFFFGWQIIALSYIVFIVLAWGDYPG